MRRSTRLAPSAPIAATAAAAVASSKRGRKSAPRTRPAAAAKAAPSAADVAAKATKAAAAAERRQGFIQLATDAKAGRRGYATRAATEMRLLCEAAGVCPDTGRPVAGGAAVDLAPLAAGYVWKKGTLDRSFEQEHWDAGRARVAGVDEAGRGPLAGPVVAAACVVAPGVAIAGVHDSKYLSEPEREALFEKITAHPGVEYGVGVADHALIDDVNILEATMRAMAAATAQLAAGTQATGTAAKGGGPAPLDCVLIDGNRVPTQMAAAAPGAHVEAVVKGDGKVFAIAAASVVAKVTRDRIMHAAHEKWPEYNFAQHKGYGTKDHQSAIHRLGPSPIHRMTFAPLKNWWPAESDEEEGGEEGGGGAVKARAPPKKKAKRGAKKK